jgi:hypothetical protein
MQKMILKTVSYSSQINYNSKKLVVLDVLEHIIFCIQTELTLKKNLCPLLVLFELLLL